MGYVYYVAYAHSSMKGSGHGSVSITFKKPISDPSHVHEIQKHIEEKYERGPVVILNWILLGEKN